ncbi:hypothetical protein ATY29_27370 [Rhizobium hidalgonense]|nr:hypothetical protein ATY29_27370 [Rhizobium hidalgonense]
MRLASPDDLKTIATLTAAAYLLYTHLFGAPPIPVPSTVPSDFRERVAGRAHIGQDGRSST